MKSARERAEDAANFAGVHSGLGYGWRRLVEALERSFKEHARDQRRICAEAVNEAGGQHHTIDRAHAAVMNAPEPGKHNE